MNIVKGVVEFVMDILETVVFIGSLFIITYLFIVQPNQVKGESMVPTFDTGDYIFTSKITYRLRPIHRGDIIVFKAPRNPDIEYIKRVIGLPGDKIRVTGGSVFLNDIELTEPYTNSRTGVWLGGFIQDNQVVTVPSGEIFVLGDNRDRSSDSREFGFVPIQTIIGQVFYRYFPTDKIGSLINPFPMNLQALNRYAVFIWT